MNTYVSAKLLKMLLVAVPLLLFIKLCVRAFNDIEIDDVVNGIGPPTSIGGESAFDGLPPEFCDVLKMNMILMNSFKKKTKMCRKPT